VIKGFKHRGLRRLFERGDGSKIHADMREKIENILFVLNRANVPSDMDLPGFRRHPLKGKLDGFWAVTVRANWRVVWRFEDTHAVDVDLVDYH
jgi:proteic killer suppression protein